jgi:hypothetical protein
VGLDPRLGERPRRVEVHAEEPGLEDVVLVHEAVAAHGTSGQERL